METSDVEKAPGAKGVLKRPAAASDPKKPAKAAKKATSAEKDENSEGVE